MTIERIEDEIKNRISKATKDFELKNKLGEYQKINVLTGLLPPKEYYKTISEYPFVMIRTHFSDDDVTNRESIQDFKLYFGICAEKEGQMRDKDNFDIEAYKNGHKDLSSLYEKVRKDFLEKTTLSNQIGYIGTIKKIKFEAFLEQPFPYFIGQMDVKIESELLREVLDFGE